MWFDEKMIRNSYVDIDSLLLSQAIDFPLDMASTFPQHRTLLNFMRALSGDWPPCDEGMTCATMIGMQVAKNWRRNDVRKSQERNSQEFRRVADPASSRRGISSFYKSKRRRFRSGCPSSFNPPPCLVNSRQVNNERPRNVGVFLKSTILKSFERVSFVFVPPLVRPRSLSTLSVPSPWPFLRPRANPETLLITWN